MEIIFEEDRTNGYLEYFAISQMQVYKGKVHDELMWAEIRPGIKGGSGGNISVVKITWEDDWQHPHFVNTLDEAKAYVLKHYSLHRPHSNGAVYNIDEM